jgi:3-hydroxyisobutyrate dehydrogenase-like beta-hydroxyacid dehydrogenase
MAAKRIGFLGATGLMGHGMARNLALKGFPVTLCVRGDRTARISDILSVGAKKVGTPAEVARASDVVVMCLTGSTAVEEVIFGDDGISGAAKPGLIVVDTSTSEVASSTNTRTLLAKQGVTFVDAPLTRTPQAAEAGKANTMVGADPATFALLKPIFQAYCEHIIHAGPPGHGLVLKLINNFVGQAITTATAEGLATAAKVSTQLSFVGSQNAHDTIFSCAYVLAQSGLDIRKLYELMCLGSVDNLMFRFMVGK